MEPTKYYIGDMTATEMWNTMHDEPVERFRLYCCRTCGIAFHVKELG